MGKHGSMPRVEGDHYQTPDWATAALAEHIELAGKTIWEPATGAGCMAEALKAAGATVFCNDIADRGYPLDAIIDFTNGAKPELAFAGIASNPPLGVQGRLTERFIEAGLHHIGGGGFLALLLSADFYSGKRRLRFFRDCPLFAAKIVLTRRIVWFSNPDPDKERPKENHAWFIWQNPPPGSAPLILYAPRNTSSSTSETATAGRPSSTPVTSSPEKDVSCLSPRCVT
jgi:hypothetical protein